MNTRRWHLIGTAAAACAVGAAAAPLQAQELSPRDIAAQARPAVVVITAITDNRASGQGSGFVVSSDGFVVTNHHVVEGADALRIRLSTGEVYDNVYLVSEDARRDLVLLRIPAADLANLSMGDDRAADVGDPVYVMGNPLGLEGTFSNGLVSAKRVLEGTELIQISAPISSGSSGGPVLNARGEVIGIATAMMRDGQNLNLAVPARYARGLLALDERPRPFSEVARQFAGGGSKPVESDDPDDPDLEPWAAVLLSEMEATSDVAEDLHLRRTHEAVFEMIDDGATYEIEYSFDQGEYTIIGVCDIDCSDLDLSVYDPSGDMVAIDVELDDRPVVGFDVTRPGSYDVQVYMATCSREPCGFVVQTFKTPPAPRTEPYVPSGSVLQEMQVGFEDVLPGAWNEWTESIADMDPSRMQAWSARAVMAHTTNAELVDVLSWRASAFRRVAHDPAGARHACSLAPMRDGPPDVSAFDLRPIARIMGRAIARDVRGDTAWRSPVDLETDEAVWEALGTYMAERGRLLFIERLLVVADGGTLDDRTSCLWQAELYDMAVRSHDDRIGPVTLLEFVRAMELLGQTEVFGE